MMEAELPRIVHLDDLPSLQGVTLGPTDWRDVTQEEITTFAEVTGDTQWIHVDVERAKEGPFGGPIAHGYFTLSLASKQIFQLLQVEGASAVINYGLNKVRFPATVPVGTALRSSILVDDVTDIAGGRQLTLTMTFERDGGSKPVCVAEIVFRYYA